MVRDHVLEAGSRVHITSYCPFRGLRGTVQVVDTIAHLAGTHCFYLVRLEGVQIKEPVWFEHQEVELVAAERSDHFGTGEVQHRKIMTVL
jgi:hypothetical protein